MKDYQPALIEIYEWERGILLREISLMAFDSGHKILAIGYEAQKLLSSADEVGSPLKDGQVADWKDSCYLFAYLIHQAMEKKTGKKHFFRKPKIAVCMLPGSTGVEKKAMEDLIYWCGAKKVILSEHSLREYISRSNEKECDFIIGIQKEA